MGTNYYWTKNPCPTCGHGELLHIGKFSAGWAFSLRIHPQEGIETFDDWKDRFAVDGSRISDECGNPVSPPEMIAVISEQPMLFVATGLMRHSKPVHGSLFWKEGEGTWDYMIGEFC